jgi:hypothetical protein
VLLSRMDEKTKTNGRGGARPGSGRRLKPIERHRVQRQFSIHPDVSRALDDAIEPGDRSSFVTEAIRISLKKFHKNY